MRRLALALLAATLLLSPPLPPVRAEGPSVTTLVDTLRFDPHSPAMKHLVRRLAELGERGWKALATLGLDYEGKGTGIPRAAAAHLVAGTEAKRREQAGRLYDRTEDDAVREPLALGLARAYPLGAERLHAHLRQNRAGALDLLRLLSARGLPAAEIEAALAHPELASLARELLDGKGQAPEVTKLVPEARALAPDGVDPKKTRAFAAAFAAKPDWALLSALAEVLREPDERLRLGAYCLLLTVSGVELAPDAALWRSWIEGRADTYVAPDPVSRGAIAAAVARGVHALRLDLVADGRCRWPSRKASETASGATALAVLALRSSGVPESDAAIRKAIEATLFVFDRGERAGLKPYSANFETYTLALLAMAIRTLDPAAYPAPLVAIRDRLAAGVLENGQWTYACPLGTTGTRPVRGDNSNTQYANLGLRALRRCGVEVDRTLWERVDAHWRGTQHKSGTWGYRVSGRDARRGLVQMTASGIAGLAIAAEGLHGTAAAARIREDESIAKGLRSLGRYLFFTELSKLETYGLYAIERACVLTGTRTFAAPGKTYDWYREGAWRLLQDQRADGTWGHPRRTVWLRHGYGYGVDTAFALLFLTRATATVGEVGTEGVVVTDLTAEEAGRVTTLHAPPATPPPAPATPTPLAAEPARPALELHLDAKRVTTSTGKAVVRGHVSGPWSAVTVAGQVAEVDDDGRFAAPVEVSATGPVEVVARGAGVEDVQTSVVVEIDRTPPGLKLVGPTIRPVGKQRVVLEGSEILDGVRIGRRYYPAYHKTVHATVELGEHNRKLVALAYDRAGNKARVALPVEVVNRVLVLDGKSAVRVALKPKPGVFTAECWVRAEAPAKTGGVIADCEGAGFGIFVYGKGRIAHGILHQGRDYARIIAKRRWVWGRWTHVALTYDGKALRYFENGKLQGEMEVANYKRSGKSIFIGADPERGSRWGSKLRGAVDEVRISDVVRYTDDFQPAFSHLADPHTLLLYHFDTDTERAILDASRAHRNGTPLGNVKIEAEKR